MAEQDKQHGTLLLILTHRCNLKCIYCYETHRSSGHAPMTAATAQRQITEHLTHSPYSRVDICFFGGEPFLQFNELREICEWTWGRSWERDYTIYVNSNGTLLNAEMKSWLRVNRNRISVSLSLDGTKESQDINRSNSYDRIDLEFFRTTWPDQSVKMTISPQSLPNLARDVIHMHDLGFQILECNLAVGIDWSGEANVEFMRRELDKLCEFYGRHPEVEPAPIVNMKIGSCENRRSLLRWCGAGKQLMTIDSDGTAYPCNFLTPMSFAPSDLALLLEAGFADTRQLMDMNCLESCYIYPVCPTCYAADFAFTGAMNQKNRSACKLVMLSAFYSALLHAKRILRADMMQMKGGDLPKTYKTIKAIRTIATMYGGI